MYVKVLTDRLAGSTENRIRGQCGFRENRICSDQVFVVKKICKDEREEKMASLAFMNLGKSQFRVDR